MLNLNECSHECISCVKAYKKKFGATSGRLQFKIECDGIPKEYATPELIRDNPELTKREIEAFFDPVIWAADYLDWHCLDPDGEVWKRKNPKEYQKWIARHPGESILGHSRYHRPYQATLLRCLHGDTDIFMADGTIKKIRDVEVGDKVVTYNEGRKQTQRSYAVLRKFQNGVRDLWRVTLENGDTLKVTANHPILSWYKDGALNEMFDCKSFKRVYKTLEDGLSIGDKVYTLNQFAIFGDNNDQDLAKLLGYIVTDGYVCNSGKIGEKHVVEFSNIRKEYVDEFVMLADKVFGLKDSEIRFHPERISKDGVTHHRFWSVAFSNRDSPLLVFLRSIGCYDKITREISILQYAFHFSAIALGAFINRCWSGDGCIYTYEGAEGGFGITHLNLSNGNRNFLLLFRYLLKKIGIYASHIYKDKKDIDAKGVSLRIERIADQEQFFNFCGLVYGKELESRKAIDNLAMRTHWRRHGGLSCLTRTKIVNIEYAGQEIVYDIEVDTRHNFIANGLVVHNCSAKQKVYRLGRQLGKCLVSGTLIQMADGSQRPIEEVQDGDLVVSLDRNYFTVVNPALRACNGIKPVMRITLMDGREIEATEHHPFLVRQKQGKATTGLRHVILEDKWLEAQDLTNDCYVAVPKNLNLSLTKHVPNYQMTILGCMIADGNLTSNNCRFSNTNEQILSRFETALKNYNCTLYQYESDKTNCDYHILGEGVGKLHPLKEWLKTIGIYGLNSHKKYIPDEFMTLDDENTIELLRCLFGCDGWASISKRGQIQIGYCTVSERLASQIIALLARFCIYADVRFKTVKCKEGKLYARQICISRKESIKNFRNKIGILGKDQAVEAVYRMSLQMKASPKTEVYEDGDIAFIRVRSVIHVGNKMTWDLTVPDTHNFIANNIITHNTEALVIAMLYLLFMRPDCPEDEGFAIVLIAPFQSQIDLVFKRLNDLILSSEKLRNSIVRSVKAPQYTLELANKSSVIGFTAGSKSNNGAAAARGQHANLLVFDESDMLNEDDMDAAMSIITNSPDAQTWASSTPTGKRESFYKMCFDDTIKEFHLPSTENPLWNEKLDLFYKKRLTRIGYIHEVLSEFGEMEGGVFQNQYISIAKSNYKYGDFVPTTGWRYIIGCDWNDIKNGVNIVVLGENPSNKYIYLVDFCCVQQVGYTQHKACEEIARLNRIWKPKAIYADKGFGATQEEMLHKWGYDALADEQRGPNHPDAFLRCTFFYDSGSTVEIRDLFTREKKKEPAKNFMVENAVRYIENGLFRYPEEDEQLSSQLQGYVIDHVAPSGKAVYKPGESGDHELDAVMLGLVAFALEFSGLGKPVPVTDVRFTKGINLSAGSEVRTDDVPLAKMGFVVSEEKSKEIKKPEQRTDLFTRPKTIIPAAHVAENSRVVNMRKYFGVTKESGNAIIRSRTYRPQRSNI
jgi:intein/homing endonuclease